MNLLGAGERSARLDRRKPVVALIDPAKTFRLAPDAGDQPKPQPDVAVDTVPVLFA